MKSNSRSTSCGIEPPEARIAPATLVVTSLLDDASGGTLRDAVNLANADPGPADTIVFAPGLTGTITIDPAKNGIPIEEPLTIKGPGIDELTVNATGTGGGALTVAAASLTMSKTVIAYHSVSGAGTAGGGGICHRGPAALEIKGSHFLGNTSAVDGGALVLPGGGPAMIKNSKFIENASDSNGDGGGIAIISGAGVIDVIGCLFRGNYADDDGGGISQDSPGLLTVSSCQFLDNVAGGPGRGIYLADGITTLAKPKVLGNSSNDGGGIHVTAATTASLASSTVTGNFAVVNPNTFGI